VIDLRTNAGSIEFLADAPTDSSTLVLPVLISQLCAEGSPCLSASNPRLRYHAVAFDTTTSTMDTVDGVASFNAFSPSVSTGGFNVVAPGARATQNIQLNRTEFARTPALGLLVISHDNRGNDEAQTIAVNVR
jgi:hypothetical protein